MGVISEIFGYVLNFLYNIISNYGLAIIIFSVLLRLILIPITIKQQKAMKKNAKIQEELKEIQAKYKNDPQKMNQETIDLYKREHASPFGGCLSMILQIFIILAVFWLVSQPLTYMRRVQNLDIYQEYKTELEQNKNGRSSYLEIAIIDAVENDYKEITRRLEAGEYEETQTVENNEQPVEQSVEQQEEQVKEIADIENSSPEQVNDGEIVNNQNNEETSKVELKTKEQLEERKQKLEELRLNMDFLGLDLSKVPNQNMTDWKIYIIPVLYVITSFLSIRLTTKSQNSNKPKEELTEQEASMQQMSKTMSYMMPIMTISIAFIAPLGLALYWLVSNLLMMVERLVIDKFINSKEDEENV